MRPIKSLTFIYVVLMLIAVSYSDPLTHQQPAAGYTEERDGAGHNDLYIIAGDEILGAIARFRNGHLKTK
jgi:hypothetical protein